jgi:hypothetical protein
MPLPSRRVRRENGYPTAKKWVLFVVTVVARSSSSFTIPHPWTRRPPSGKRSGWRRSWPKSTNELGNIQIEFNCPNNQFAPLKPLAPVSHPPRDKENRNGCATSPPKWKQKISHEPQSREYRPEYLSLHRCKIVRRVSLPARILIGSAHLSRTNAKSQYDCQVLAPGDYSRSPVCAKLSCSRRA